MLSSARSHPQFMFGSIGVRLAARYLSSALVCSTTILCVFDQSSALSAPLAFSCIVWATLKRIPIHKPYTIPFISLSAKVTAAAVVKL
jgi:hypothetical protein